MKALSVKQPFAGLIANGNKHFEVRSWIPKTEYYDRDILLCAGKSWFEPRDAVRWPGSLPGHWEYRGMGIAIIRILRSYPLHITDVANVCLTHDFIAELLKKKKHYAWFIAAKIQKVKPFPVKDRLGFFDVDDSLIEVMK